MSPTAGTAEDMEVTQSLRRRFGVPSDADDAVRLFDQTSDVGWSHPLAAHRHQVIISRPTGNRAALSNVDRDFVLAGLGEQVAHRWDAESFKSLADVGLEQLCRVSGEHNANRLAGFD